MAGKPQEEEPDAGDQRILLDPPDWTRLDDEQVSSFAEAVNTLLDCGIFRPPLAAELTRYRDAASTELRDRVAGRIAER